MVERTDHDTHSGENAPMTGKALTRKSIQHRMDIFQELTYIKGQLTIKYSKTMNPREATFDDVMEYLLGRKK